MKMKQAPLYLLALLSLTPALAQTPSLPPHVTEAVTTCQIFGDGAKPVKIVLRYDQPVKQNSLKPSTFAVDGRVIKQLYANTSEASSAQGRGGHYVILELEATTDLTERPRPVMTAADSAKRAERDRQQGGPGLKAGWSTGGSEVREVTVALRQRLPLKTTAGATYPADTTTFRPEKMRYLLADDFQQHEFKSPYTGAVLPYNLYLPKDYDPKKSYPLVLFIHDAGVASAPVKSPLLQGRGAVTWAEADFQAKNPCIIVAPQYPFVTVDDVWNYSHHLDATVALLRQLQKDYAVDPSRIYTTGQSMGCMSSMVLLLKEPQLFAGALLVAGKWNPEVLAPLALQNLWIISCEGDISSTELQSQAVALWRSQGATVSEATWNMLSTPAEFARSAQQQLQPDTHLYYTHLTGGSHRGTWAVAYDIDGVKDWLFSQRRK